MFVMISDLDLYGVWKCQSDCHHIVHKHRQTRYTIAIELLEHPPRLPRTRIFHSCVWNPDPTATRLSHAGWRTDLRTQPETGL